MLNGSNRIYGRHMIIHNGQFAECEILESFQGLCGLRTWTRTCKLVLEDHRRQGLSSRLQHCLYPNRATEHKCKLMLMAKSPESVHKKLELIAPVFFSSYRVNNCESVTYGITYVRTYGTARCYIPRLAYWRRDN